METKNDHNGLTAGSFLVAAPFLSDPNFRRGVVLICDHHKEGSVGFIMNKSVGMNIASLVADFPEFDSDVFYGGPVQTDTVHYIHNKGDLLEGSLKIMEGVYWGGDFQQLKNLIKSEVILPQNIRFFVGYSGWGGGQLGTEIKELSWLIANGDANYVFNPQNKDLWQLVLENQGDTYSVIAQMQPPIWN